MKIARNPCWDMSQWEWPPALKPSSPIPSSSPRIGVFQPEEADCPLCCFSLREMCLVRCQQIRLVHSGSRRLALQPGPHPPSSKLASLGSGLQFVIRRKNLSLQAKIQRLKLPQEKENKPNHQIICSSNIYWWISINIINTYLSPLLLALEIK